MTPRITICIPSRSESATPTMLTLAAVVNWLTANGMMGRLLNFQATNTSDGRNRLVLDALTYSEEKPTHIFWMDSDQVVPADIIGLLLSHRLPVVGCFYSTRIPPYRLSGELCNPASWDEGGLGPAKCLPGGCCLIEMSVYENVPPPWYFDHYEKEAIRDGNPFGHVGEDENFTRGCIRAGYVPMCDINSSYKVGHQGTVIKMIGGDLGICGGIDMKDLKSR